ncbi:MAG: response regulator [Candidatus Marinimicrobia bacterium]|nr:response regulator [Candidatus Neomarinimicrobiota bacterium]MCF7829640.1 response regulator [Candidatus Neomarinimicrobiota bacterium]MCF7879800.1 response regulator [Candidatus Neomarinimicrobiota bacterium]
MNNKIKILVMEDNPSDAALMIEVIKREGFDPEWQRVITKQEFLESLDQSIDVILADHTLPQFDAIQALTLLNERKGEIPFIIVSGTISEEAAIEGLRLGATDYVLKDRLARLGPSVRDAIERHQLQVEKHKAESELRQSEQKFRLLANNAQDIIYRLTMKPKPMMDYISPAVEHLTGYAQDEFYRDPDLIFDNVHPDDYLALEDRLFKSQNFGDPLRIRWIRKDGDVLWMDHRSTEITDDSGEMIALEGIARDITDLMEMQKSVERSEQLFRGIFENMQEGFYRTSPEGKILLVNPQFARILGYEKPDELEGKVLDKLCHFEKYPRDEFRRMVEDQGKIINYQTTWIHKDGHLITIRENAHVVRNEAGDVQYYEGTIEDYTEQKALEEQLIQSQKVESLGQVAGGIAHDFNNVLASLSGSIQMLDTLTSQGSDLRKYIEMASSSIDQAESITNRLLTFTRTEEPDPEPVALVQFLRGMYDILSHTLPKTVEVNIEEYEGNDLALIEKNELQQVVMNLCINASHAMPDGGNITMNLYRPTEEEVRRHKSPADSDPFICLSISDTGVGIDEDVIDRIFEPFFTTKSQGEGTGLGLAVSHQIIIKHDGWIDVESTAGEGTIFTIGLPMASSKPKDEPEIEDVQAYEGSGEHILIIDDEDQICNLLTDFLSSHGYEVSTASTGKSGLQKYQENTDVYDLILTDLGLPEISGIELTKEIKSARPEAKIVATTGYLETDEIKKIRDKGFVTIIQKPFELINVIQTVYKALHQ